MCEARWSRLRVAVVLAYTEVTESNPEVDYATYKPEVYKIPMVRMSRRDWRICECTDLKAWVCRNAYDWYQSANVV